MTRPAGRRWMQIRAAMAARNEPCAICRQPIDYGLRWPHPDAFVIDHRWPLAHGGHPTSDRNLRPAHNRCNRTKSDRLPVRGDGHPSRPW